MCMADRCITSRKALGWKSLAVLFSIGVAINCLFQLIIVAGAHGRAAHFNASYGLNPYFVTGAMAIVTAMVAIGGVRRIGRFCEALVPFMTVTLPRLAASIILAANASRKCLQPLREIFRYALAPAPASWRFRWCCRDVGDPDGHGARYVVE